MALSSKMQRWLLMSFIVSICLCGLLGIAALLLSRFGWWELRVLLTTATVSAASILAMVSAIAWETRRWRWIGLAGMIAPAVGLVLILLEIWDIRPSSWVDTFEQFMGMVCVLAVAFPHLSLLSLARLNLGYEWVRRFTAGAIALLSLIVIGFVFRFINDDDWFRIMGALGIAAACGTIAVAILHRVSRIRKSEAIQTSARVVQLTCPRCGVAQSLPTGGARCACGLTIRIEIEEEHCPKCGYSLYKLASANCPECGTPIAPSQFERPDATPTAR